MWETLLLHQKVEVGIVRPYYQFFLLLMQFKARKFNFLDPSKANFIAWQKSEPLDNSKENFSIFMDSTQG